MRRRKKTQATPTIEVSTSENETAKAAMSDFLGTTPAHARANATRRTSRVGQKNKPVEAPSGDPWGEVIETVFDLDPVALAERLTIELNLGLFSGDFGRLRAALDDAAKNYFDAKRLERAAKLEEQRFLDDEADKMDILRSEARKLVKSNHEKGDGPITKQMVEDMMIATWPDSVSVHRKRKRELHHAAKALEGLAEAWNHRNSQLKVMLERTALGRPRAEGR